MSRFPLFSLDLPVSPVPTSPAASVPAVDLPNRLPSDRRLPCLLTLSLGRNPPADFAAHESNNAGVMATPFMLSQDSIEIQFATNHTGHFLLTNLLLDNMKKTAYESGKEGRFVILSSEAHRFPYHEGIRFDKINDESSYSSMYAYGQSKLANILHATELARHLKPWSVLEDPLYESSTLLAQKTTMAALHHLRQIS